MRERSKSPNVTSTRSPAGRAARMASLGMGVAGSYVGYLLQSVFSGRDRRRSQLAAAHTRAARRIRRELESLRGPAMKLGQTLSLHAGVLPDEVLRELSSLQREAPGMHPTLVRIQFKASIGRFPEDVYASFEEVPFAAASLGQVHRATLPDGTRLAVKIQYPGIRDAITGDFAWFRAVSKPAQVSAHLPAAAIDELERQIVAETDYVREAKNLKSFRGGLAPLTFMAVPAVLPQLSSSKVLTMTLLSGEHLDAFLAKRPPAALRNLIGERLVELFYFQLLRLNAIHADPHWGNYLFREDGTIGLVDFGCVKRFDRTFVEDLQEFFLYPGSRTSADFQRLLDHRYETMGHRITPGGRRTLMHFAEDFYARVFPPQPERENDRFDFGDASFLRQYLRASQELVKSRGILPEYVFLARAEIGLYQTLHRLRAHVATSRIVRAYLTARTAARRA
jgi:predicted unusual protein kinase regulating ubiquinone biosynthesis (AarF/ABC1/UbiB family)